MLRDRISLLRGAGQAETLIGSLSLLRIWSVSMLMLFLRGGATIDSVRKATRTIPIVFVAEGDPVVSGLVGSLAHPGGNLTGLTVLGHDLARKRLELLKEVIPRISHVAVLWYSTSDVTQVRTTEAGAQALKLQVRILEVKDPNDFAAAFATAKREHAEALDVLVSTFLTTHRKPLLDLAVKSHLPSMYEDKIFVGDGRLMSYGPSLPGIYRHAATYVDKILKGAKPADCQWSNQRNSNS